MRWPRGEDVASHTGTIFGTRTCLDGTDAFKDATAPSLTVTEPEDGVVVELSTVTVRGACTDEHLQTFTVNGEETPRDGSGAFEKAVFLSGGAWGTYIEATAEDAYRNVTTVTRTVEVAPLEIEITSPQDGAVLDATSVTVTGTVKGPRDAEVFVNGQRAARDGETFTLAALALTEGENVITAHAMTPHTFSEHTVLVIRDTTNPVVTIYSPEDGDIIGTSTVNVEGWVEDDSLQSVSVNGQAAELFGNYFVAQNVPLNTEGGDNSIEVVATDAVGHIGEAEIAVTRDTTAPSLAITSPADGSTVHTRLVTVSGTVSDASLRQVEVNGWQAALGSGTFSRGNIALDIEGQNTITAVARDAAGHESQVSVTVTRNLPPAVTISDVVFSERSTDEVMKVKILGTVDEPTASITARNVSHPDRWVKLPNGEWKRCPNANAVNGTNVNGSFTADGLDVYRGDNLLVVQAADAQGQKGYAEAVVTVEDPPEAYDLPRHDDNSEQAEVVPVLTVAGPGQAGEGGGTEGLLGGETFMTFGQLLLLEGQQTPPTLTVSVTPSITVWQASDLKFAVSAALDCSWELYSATLTFPTAGLTIFDNGNGNSGATVYTDADPDPDLWWEVDAASSCRTDTTSEGIRATGVKARRMKPDHTYEYRDVPNSNRVDVLVDAVKEVKLTSVSGGQDLGADSQGNHSILLDEDRASCTVTCAASTVLGKLDSTISWQIGTEDAGTGSTITKELQAASSRLLVTAYGDAKNEKGQDAARPGRGPQGTTPPKPDPEAGESSAKLGVDAGYATLTIESPYAASTQDYTPLLLVNGKRGKATVTFQYLDTEPTVVEWKSAAPGVVAIVDAGNTAGKKTVELDAYSEGTTGITVDVKAGTSSQSASHSAALREVPPAAAQPNAGAAAPAAPKKKAITKPVASEELQVTIEQRTRIKFRVQDELDVSVRAKNPLAFDSFQFDVRIQSSQGGEASAVPIGFQWINIPPDGHGPIYLKGTAQSADPKDKIAVKLYHSGAGSNARPVATGSYCVSAWPTKFRFVRQEERKDIAVVFHYAWDSDSGYLKDLGKVKVYERVEFPGGNPFTAPEPFFIGTQVPNPFSAPPVTGSKGKASDQHSVQITNDRWRPWLEAHKQGIVNFMRRSTMTGTSETLELQAYSATQHYLFQDLRSRQEGDRTDLSSGQILRGPMDIRRAILVVKTRKAIDRPPQVTKQGTKRWYRVSVEFRYQLTKDGRSYERKLPGGESEDVPMQE